MDQFKRYHHNPPHLFRSNSIYFITGAIYQKRNLLYADDAKSRLLKSLNIGFNSKGWKLKEWVILHNHYHLIAHSPEDADSLADIIRDIHKFTALWIRKHIRETAALKKVWWNYWDTCITYEKSYFARINYIWYNPEKHKLTSDSRTWKFGSLYTRVINDNRQIEKFKNQYPHDSVNVKDDF